MFKLVTQKLIAIAIVVIIALILIFIAQYIYSKSTTKALKSTVETQQTTIAVQKEANAKLADTVQTEIKLGEANVAAVVNLQKEVTKRRDAVLAQKNAVVATPTLDDAEASVKAINSLWWSYCDASAKCKEAQ